MVDFTNREQVIDHIYKKIGHAKAQNTGYEIVIAVDACLKIFGKKDRELSPSEKTQYILMAYNNAVRKARKKDWKYLSTHLDGEIIQLLAKDNGTDLESELMLKHDITQQFGDDGYNLYCDRAFHRDTFINLGKKVGMSRLRTAEHFGAIDKFIRSAYNNSNSTDE